MKETLKKWVGLVLLITAFLPVFCSGACDWVGPGTDASVASEVYSLNENEDSPADTGYVVQQYSVAAGCTCGIVTHWRFYARKSGTVIMYVFDTAHTVKGYTAITVPPLSADNYFEIPVSSEMWISVQENDLIGFFSENEPMITWNDGPSEPYSRGAASILSLGDSNGLSAGANLTDKQYAFAAKVEDAHAPMFLNLPFAITLYTHSTGTVIRTVSVTDLDPDDVAANLTVTMAATAGFVFDQVTGQVTYDTKQTEGTYTLNFDVSDGCHAAITSTIVVTLVNEGPQFINLPNTESFNETNEATGIFFTISTTDPSGDVVTCLLKSTNPATAPFSLSGFDISLDDASFDFTVARHYTLTIECTDGVTSIESVFVVDIIKNEPPTYNVGGELPASVAVDRSAGVAIYTVAMTDPEGDTLTYTSNGCTSVSIACPFDIADPLTGVITTTGQLDEPGYDLKISISDGKNTVGPHILSVLVSVDGALPFNEAPSFGNLPATKNVMENTAAGTYLYTIALLDPNVQDNLTLTNTYVSDNGILTYFEVDLTTGVISVKAPVDFDTIGSNGLASDNGLTMTFNVTDGTDTATGNFTINIENVNEGPSIALTRTDFTADEGPKDSAFTEILEVQVTDDDLLRGNDTHYITTSCGSDSKYIYTNLTNAGLVVSGSITNTYEIRFARDLDLDDSTFPSSIACTVTVYDQKRISDSASITLNIANINDHYPAFAKQQYTFLVSSTAQFGKIVTTFTATDADSTEFGSTLGNLTYAIETVGADVFFMIDSNAILYVNDVSSQSQGTLYTFTITAEDNGGLIGRASITIIFPQVETVTTTTTTTERNFLFQEEAANAAWLVVLGIAVMAILIVTVCLVYHDPRMHDYLCWKADFYYQLLCLKEEREPTRTSGKLTVTLQGQTLESDQQKSELHVPRPETPESEQAEAVVDQWGKRRLSTPLSDVSETEAEIHSTSSEDHEDDAQLGVRVSPEGVSDGDDRSDHDAQGDDKELTEQWGELKHEKDVHVSQIGGKLPPTIVEPKKDPVSSPLPDSTLHTEDDTELTNDEGLSVDTPLPIPDTWNLEKQSHFPRTTHDFDEPHPSKIVPVVIGQSSQFPHLLVPGATPHDISGLKVPHRTWVLSPVFEGMEGQLSRSSTIIADPLHPGRDQVSPHVTFRMPTDDLTQPRHEHKYQAKDLSHGDHRKSEDSRPTDKAKTGDKKSTNSRRKRRHRVLPEEPAKPKTPEEEPKPTLRRYDKPLPEDIVQHPWNDSQFVSLVTSRQQSKQ